MFRQLIEIDMNIVQNKGAFVKMDKNTDTFSVHKAGNQIIVKKLSHESNSIFVFTDHTIERLKFCVNCAYGFSGIFAASDEARITGPQ